MVELSFGLKEDSALLGEVLLGQCPRLTTTFGQVGPDVVFDREITAVSVPEENKAHNGKEVLVAGVVGVRAQGVRGAPEPLFDGFDMFKLCQCSLH